MYPFIVLAIASLQIQYLGLMENLRVRRAGFAYRREYPVFLKRYLLSNYSKKCLLCICDEINDTMISL